MHDAAMTGNAPAIFFFAPGATEGDPGRKNLLGGKGAALAAMTKAGLPVPPGFTIPIPCCRYYHEHGKKWPEGMRQSVRGYMAKLETVTGRKYAAGQDPLLVSVRSGAAQSMPGMMDTILNCGLHPGLADTVPDAERFWKVYALFIRRFARIVTGMPNAPFEEIAARHDGKKRAEGFIELYEKETRTGFPVDPWDALVACINTVFDSWNSERAHVYRNAHGLTDLEGTAATVQSMFDAEISGIAFTADPAHPDEKRIIIESSYGLGESVVSGDVAPDRFVLDSRSLAIREKEIGRKTEVMEGLTGGRVCDFDPDAPSLTDSQIVECAQMALKVEEFFGFPVDIEWSVKDGAFSLLQSRPVRGLEIARAVEPSRKEEIARLKRVAGKKRKVWVVHNLAETLTAPTPLAWDITKLYMSGNGGYGLMYEDLGYLPSDGFKRDGFLELILGRIYADPELAAGMFWKGMPLTYNADDVLENPDAILAPPTSFDAEKTDGMFLLRLPGTALAMIKNARILKKARKNAQTDFEERKKPYVEYILAKRDENLSPLATKKVIAALNERIAKVMRDFGRASLKPGFFGGLAMSELEKKLQQLLGTKAGTVLSRTLASGLDGDSTMEQEVFLHKAAAGEATIAGFMQRYGHRAVGEMELAAPRWREDASYIEQTIETIRSSAGISPEKLHTAKKEAREKAMRDLPGTLEQWGGSFMTAEITALAKEAQTLLPYRENGKHYLMMGYEIIRNAILELGKRWNLGNDVFFLRLDELTDFEDRPEHFAAVAAKRKTVWQALKRLDHPDIIASDKLDGLGMPREIKTSNSLDGKSLSGGVAEGEARIVFHPAEAGNLAGAVLVCPSTDPSWTSLFTRIRGIVVERGGVLSHGAITARDFGIPAVACRDATRVIRDGTRIRVNGDTGNVAVMEE